MCRLLRALSKDLLLIEMGFQHIRQAFLDTLHINYEFQIVNLWMCSKLALSFHAQNMYQF